MNLIVMLMMGFGEDVSGQKGRGGVLLVLHMDKAELQTRLNHGSRRCWSVVVRQMFSLVGDMRLSLAWLSCLGIDGCGWV